MGAFLVDLFIGDPAGIPHPVVLMGKSISSLEELLRRIVKSPPAKRLAGVILVATIVGSSYFITHLIVKSLGGLSRALAAGATVWFISTTIAARGLDRAAMTVYDLLLKGDLASARRQLSYIVGRDTDDLSESHIMRAAVETVAENTVDAVVSPVFYAFLGGAPLAMAYRAINTLDSMVGHRNERYLHFGWAGAKLDDIANWVPARLAGGLLTIACLFLGKDFRGAWQAIMRDACQHPSPNSGIMEAGVAGALGVRLGGINYYGGVPSFRGYFGPGRRPLEVSDIRESVRLMYYVAFLEIILGLFAGAASSLLLKWGV